MRTYKCSFCGSDVMPGYGMMYVKVDGTVLRFCSRKCFVSMVRFGRDPRRQIWVREITRSKTSRSSS